MVTNNMDKFGAGSMHDEKVFVVSRIPSQHLVGVSWSN